MSSSTEPNTQPQVSTTRWLLIGLTVYFFSLIPGYVSDGQLITAIATFTLSISILLVSLMPKHPLVGVMNFLMGLSIATLMFGIGMQVLPGLRSAHLFYPDVRLGASATRVDVLGDRTPPPGTSFVVIEATVQSVYGDRGQTLSPYAFTLKANGETYTYSHAVFSDLAGACDETPVPPGGSAHCNVAFEVPEQIKDGKLRFGSLTAFDEVAVSF